MPGVGAQATGAVAVWVAVKKIISVPAPSLFGLPLGLPKNVTVSSPVFFGWGETAPDQEFDPEWEDVKNDLRGTRKPYDKMYEGQDANVTVTMTVWDESVFQGLMAFTNNGNPGTDFLYDTGTLAFSEGIAYDLWLVYPYALTHPYMVNAGMKAGYHYFAAIMQGKPKRRVGNQPNAVICQWYCGGLLKKGAEPNAGAFFTYDNDMSALAGLPTTLNPFLG